MNATPRRVSNQRMNAGLLKKPPSRFTLSVSLILLIGGMAWTATAGGTDVNFSLYKSMDRGASWSKVGEGLPSDARINALGAVGNVVIAGTDRGIFVSGDGGANWQPPGHGVATGSRVLSLASQARRVFAGTERHGVLRSDDEGNTWAAVNTGLTDPYVRSLAATTAAVYAGTDRQGVFVSRDAGASWMNRRAGLPDPSQVFDLASLGETLFAALYSQGLYRWDPTLGAWAKTGEVCPLEVVAAGKSLVVGHNPGGVFVSADAGKTWLDGNVGLPPNAPIWTLAADDERVLVGTSGSVGIIPEEVGLFASTDHGKSWVRSDTGLPPSSAAISFLLTKQFILAGVVSRTVSSEAAGR